MIEVDDIVISLGKKRIFNHTSISISSGVITYLIGENGAGKTTLLKAILGDLPVQSGSIKTLGYSPKKDRHTILSKTGVVFTESKLPPDLQIRDIYNLYLEAYHISRPSVAFQDLAERFTIFKYWKRYAGALSSGEKRKILIAFSLLHNPNLLIFDEVNNFLDPCAKIEFKSFLEEFVKQIDRTVFFATHDYSLFFTENTCINIVAKGEIYEVPIPKQESEETRKSISNLEKSIKAILS